MFIRWIFLYRSILNYSPYTDAFTRKLCQENGFNFSYLFMVKCMFHKAPFKFVLINFILFVIFFSQLLRTFEEPINRFKIKDDPSIVSGYFDSVYLTIITITTVGYGDMSPHSEMGKVVMSLAAFFGSMLISLLVLTISKHFNLGSRQIKVFHNI